MKTLKLVFGIIALCMGVSSNAQQILSSDMTITKPIYFMKVGGNPVKMDPAKDSCTVRFFKFNDGYITYDLELSGSTIRKMLKDGGEAGEKNEFHMDRQHKQNCKFSMHQRRAHTKRRLSCISCNNTVSADGWFSFSTTRRLDGTHYRTNRFYFRHKHRHDSQRDKRQVEGNVKRSKTS